MNEVKKTKQTNTYYIAVSIIYTFKKTKLNLYKEFVQTNTLTSSNYKKLSPNKYYIEYAIFKLDENNTKIYEEVFYSKIIALHLKCFM